MIIAPMFSSGENMALRAPMAIFASPVRSLHHSSNRSPAESPLCSMAARSPKRRFSCENICGVSEISGTRKMAVLPRCSARLMTFRYISVLPLPVTPCTSCTVRQSRSMPSSAADCAGVSTLPASSPSANPEGERFMRTLSMSAPPFSTTAFTAPRPNFSQQGV